MLKNLLTSRTARGSFLAVADQGVLSLSNFLTGVLAAKTLSPNDFGIFSLFFAAMVILSGIQNSLVTGPIRVLGVRACVEERSQYFSNQLYLQVILGSVISVMAIIVILLFSFSGANLAISFALSVFLLQLQELFRVINLTKLAIGSLVRLDVVTHSLRIGTMLILAANDLVTLPAIFLAIAVSSGVGVFIYRDRVVNGAEHRHTLRAAASENWGFGRWLLLEAFAYSASVQLYLYITALIIDTQSVAALYAVLSMLNMVNVLLSGVMGFAIPVARQRLLATGYKDWKRWLFRVGVLLTGATAIFWVAVSVLAAPLLNIIYTEFYADYSNLVLIIGASYLFRAVNTVLLAGFRTSGQPHIGFRAQVASAFVTLLAVYPLLKIWGVAGAAVGIVLTQIVWALVYSFYVITGSLSEDNVLAEGRMGVGLLKR